jgi:carbamoyltransferase
MRTPILGICTQPDGFSAAIVDRNKVVSAIEQFKIREHWSPHESAPLPEDAVRAALKIAHIDGNEIDAVAFTSEMDDDTEKMVPHIRALGLNPRAQFKPVNRRLAHAAAAFFSSPFDRAAILVFGAGAGSESSICAIGDGSQIGFDQRGRRHSNFGRLYQRVASTLGFNACTLNKLTWLGARGEPEYVDLFRQILNAGASGETLKLDRPHNAAASLQALTDEVVVGIAEDLCHKYDAENICFAGRLAENPLLVRKLEQHFGTRHVFIPPAPGHESLSIGAALAGSRLEGALYPAIGPEYSDSEIKEELDNCKLVSTFIPCDEALADRTCAAIAEGGIAGWFQGRCEFGHRALGFRSIFANPFTPYIDENINRFLKHRESFHPFVVSVPEEAASEYFNDVGPNARTIASVYAVTGPRREMLSKFTVQDVYVRVHTVSRTDNPLFWMLLWKVQTVTGHPLLINTSFNLPGEPLVVTPRDAIRSFYASGMDILVMGRFLVVK